MPAGKILAIGSRTDSFRKSRMNIAQFHPSGVGGGDTGQFACITRGGEQPSKGKGSEKLGEVAALGRGSDAVGGAESKRFDGHGGLAAAGGNQAAAIAEDKIVDVVGAVIFVDH
jgi:hypothetical protein